MESILLGFLLLSNNFQLVVLLSLNLFSLTDFVLQEDNQFVKFFAIRHTNHVKEWQELSYGDTVSHHELESI